MWVVLLLARVIPLISMTTTLPIGYFMPNLDSPLSSSWQRPYVLRTYWCALLAHHGDDPT